MGQFLQVNGDYNIKAGEGARITLDTGPATSGGAVRITGNLVVDGETVSVSANNLNVEDNILIVNYYGEDRDDVPAGVALDYSGIEVDRGTLSPAVFLYDEGTAGDPLDLPSWMIANNSAPGPFNYDESNLRLRRILTNPTTDNGDLTLIGSGTGLVKVSGTTEYEQEIINRELAVPGSADDILTNKKYVDDAILNNPTFQIVSPQNQDTLVIITDKEISPNTADEPGSLAYFEDRTSYVLTESAVSVIVDTALVAQFFTNRINLGNLEVGSGLLGNQITSKAGISDDNIYIKTVGTGKLQTNNAIQLDKIADPGAYVSGSTLIYAKSPDTGETGVWFYNDASDETKRKGELISKNKAFVFSMLF